MSSRAARGDEGGVARVSIVTINRNDAAGLARTLRSIRALRALRPLEHVVVDGASTDGSLELLAGEAAAGPGTVVVSEPDTGIYDAMNKGWRLAHGEHVAFVNSGDEVIPEAFGAYLDFAASGEADVYYARTVVRDPRSGATRVHERHSHQLDRDTVPHLTTLTRRSRLEACRGFDQRYRICADRDLFLRLREDGATFRFFDGTVAVFDLGGASSSKLATRLEDLRINRAHGLVGPVRFAVKRALLGLRSLGGAR
jgi:glycosyltransferase involved in cell wall biosynthesis